MKKILASLAVLLIAMRLVAQTNLPARLALVAGPNEAAGAVDLLTAQLSGDNRFQLLERDEIDKVYHEQGLSAANRDDVKLGRILGADGLLLLDFKTAASPANSNMPLRSSQNGILTIRFISVKPGVILTDGSFDWPPKDPTSWAESTADYLRLFLPKLSVQAKDAIPISVVNLRAAIQSPGELALEHELKLLTIQRLSQEPRFFVLEREKMQLLGEEKNLKADESAFWDGSYLLEGTIDQNGYSKDTITINARLNPPKGGVPVLFEVSGSRTNLTEAINALAVKVADTLNINSSIKAWGSADEAAQYFNEAKWALKWERYGESQAAAESAWALGKTDLDCALVRVRSYVDGIPNIEDAIEKHFQSMDDSLSGHEDPHYVHINYPPDPENIDRAIYALNAYEQFSRTSTNGIPEILSRPHWNDWHDSDWYKLGIDALEAASHVLQHYCLNPQWQPPVADKLADLRSLARSVAALISQSQSVHDSYYVGDRIVTRDELVYTMQLNPNLFKCEVNWGCFWQERPEDALSVYRQLLDSPVFCYIHGDFWNRTSIQPRLVAWNQDDQKEIPTIWNHFLAELDNSTNVLWRMEAKALMKADAKNEQQSQAALAAWRNLVRSNRDELVGNNVEIFYLGWGFDYTPETQGMDTDYHFKTIPNRQMSSAFAQQKKYLANFTPYNFSTFVDVFSVRHQSYTKTEAAELLPLVEAYKSNLLAEASPQQMFKAKGDVQWITVFLERPINQILNAPAPTPVNTVAKQPAQAPPPTATASIAAKKTGPPEEIPTNILLVSCFIKIPSNQIQSNDISGNQIFAQRWSEGKFLCGIGYTERTNQYDSNGNWVSGSEVTFTTIAIFNPANEMWKFVNCPEVHHGGYFEFTLQASNNRLILFHDDLYSSMYGAIEKFDFQNQKWLTLNIPEQEGCNLFSVAGHLYAANPGMIFELTDDGSFHLLASTRRRPAVTMLDSFESFASLPFVPYPQLFAGADQSLCASIGNNIYRWDGSDWHKILTVDISRPPDIFDDAVIFRSIMNRSPQGEPLNLWVWDKTASPPELCLSENPPSRPGNSYPLVPQQTSAGLHPHWQSLPGDYLTSASAMFYHSNLCFLVNHATVTNVNGMPKALDQNGYNVKFVLLSRDSRKPMVVPLKFDPARGLPPLKLMRSFPLDAPTHDTKTYISGDTLYLAQRNVPGIWALPVSELQADIAAQQQIQAAQTAQKIFTEK